MLFSSGVLCPVNIVILQGLKPFGLNLVFIQTVIPKTFIMNWIYIKANGLIDSPHLSQSLYR